MEDGADILDWLVAGGIALVAVVWIVGAIAAASSAGFELGAILSAFLGLVFLYVAYGVYRGTPEAWGIGLTLLGFSLAWSILAILLGRPQPNTSDVLTLLGEVGVVAYLWVRRDRFRAERAEDVTAPPKAGAPP